MGRDLLDASLAISVQARSGAQISGCGLLIEWEACVRRRLAWITTTTLTPSTASASVGPVPAKRDSTTGPMKKPAIRSNDNSYLKYRSRS